MANFSLFFPKIFTHEGGYQNDPADSGNYYNGKLIGTNMGISAPTLAVYLKRAPTVDDMKAVTKDTVLKIMKGWYWDKWRADLINNQSVAEILVDWVWASGGDGITIPQEIIGVDPDGVVGQVTINTLNQWDQRLLHSEIQQARLQFIDLVCERSPKNLRFKKGWITRVNSFRYHE